MNVVTIDHETLREVARGPRQKSWVVKHRWLALFVGLPTLLAIVYYGLIASPVYVSHSSFVIKSPSQKSTPSLSLANIVQTAGLTVGSALLGLKEGDTISWPINGGASMDVQVIRVTEQPERDGNFAA